MFGWSFDLSNVLLPIGLLPSCMLLVLLPKVFDGFCFVLYRWCFFPVGDVVLILCMLRPN